MIISHTLSGDTYVFEEEFADMIVSIGCGGGERDSETVSSSNGLVQ